MVQLILSPGEMKDWKITLDQDMSPKATIAEGVWRQVLLLSQQSNTDFRRGIPQNLHVLSQIMKYFKPFL